VHPTNKYFERNEKKTDSSKAMAGAIQQQRKQNEKTEKMTPKPMTGVD
jgi:hypothetical protein